MTEGPKLIYKQIPAILAEVGHIGKDQTNRQQGYHYRGIDQLYSAIHPLLAKHKVFPTSEVIDRHVIERESRGGGALFYTTLRIKYTLWAEDGSSVTTEAVGEAMDSGDKSSNKAMSAAYKYALFQLFCIPTEAVDSETETHEVAPKRTDVKYRQPELEPPQEPYRSPPVHPGPEKRYEEPPRQEPPARQFNDEKPACPECGESFAVMRVRKDLLKPGEPKFYCWKKKEHPERQGLFGCGAKFDASGDPREGSQAPPRKEEQESMDSFDSWARIILRTPAGSEEGAVATITKAYQDKRLTSQYVYQIIERATQIASTQAQGDVTEAVASRLKDTCQLPERGKYGWLNFSELFPIMQDRIEQGGGKEIPF